MPINKTLICMIILVSFSECVFAEADTNRHQLSAEYGLSYHDVTGQEKNNGSKGIITSQMSPYWKGTWTHRLFRSFGYRLSFKTQLVEFDKPDDVELKKRKQTFLTGEFALLWQQNPYLQNSIFYRQQERMIYRAQAPTQFEVLKRPFAQPGFGMNWGNRRRIGFLIGLNIEAFAMLPTKSESIVTGLGYGYGGSLRMGWISARGIVTTIKGFYDQGISPNSTIDFTHTEVGYSLTTTLSF